MVYGNGFFGDVWSGLKKGYNYLKQVQPSQYVGMVQHPYAQNIATALKTVGLGKTKEEE